MQESWKRPILIGVDSTLLDQAEDLDLDVSEIAQRALKRAIATKSKSARKGQSGVTLHGDIGKRMRYRPQNGDS